MILKGNAISVVGCGWLGLPVCEKAIEYGVYVVGTTTRSDNIVELNKLGIETYVLSLPFDEINSAIVEVDYLLINIPPGRRNPDVLKNYEKAISSLLTKAKRSEKLKKLIFISSTSVYGPKRGHITEQTIALPETESGKAILNAEQLIVKSGIPYVILRFGGLAGPNRHPGKFLAGKTLPTSGKDPINYLHLNDAIGVIMHMIKHQLLNEIYNVVSPIHPSKEDFYAKMARSINLDPPVFVSSSEGNQREISIDKLLKETDFAFEYPDPMKYMY